MLVPTNDLNGKILELLALGSIRAEACKSNEGIIFVNRDDMCSNYPVKEVKNIPEEPGGAYSLVLDDIRKLDENQEYHIMWVGKCDEVYLLEINKRSRNKGN